MKSDTPHVKGIKPMALLATNDATLVGGPLVTGRAFGEFLIDSADELLVEARPRAFVDHVQARPDAWICRRGDVAAHGRAHVPPPEGA